MTINFWQYRGRCAAAVLLAFLSLAALSALAAAQPAPAPAAALAPILPPFEVAGFRGAKFGMTKPQVRAAITNDFPERADKIDEFSNRVDGTTSLAIRMDRLDPAPGKASVIYIFGKDSQELIHVNVAWTLDPTEADSERENLIMAGLALKNHFEAHRWAEGNVFRNVPVGSNSIVLFLARGMTGGAVEVRADGVGFTRRESEEGPVVRSPPPTGPALLRIAYTQSTERPDVARIQPGQF
jgi:hypothetical protein